MMVKSGLFYFEIEQAPSEIPANLPDQLTDCHVKFSVNRIFRQAKLVRRNTLTTHVFLF
jgi:hypothetical protein